MLLKQWPWCQQWAQMQICCITQKLQLLSFWQRPWMSAFSTVMSVCCSSSFGRFDYVLLCLYSQECPWYRELLICVPIDQDLPPGKLAGGCAKFPDQHPEASPCLLQTFSVLYMGTLIICQHSYSKLELLSGLKGFHQEQIT